MKKTIKKLLLLGILCLCFGMKLHAQIILCSTYSIQGPVVICSSGTYSISPALPTGISVTWSVTGDLSISGSTTSSTVNVVKTATGGGVLKATISNACGSGDLGLFNITTSDPPAAPSIDGPSTICAYSEGYSYTVYAPWATGDIHWTMSPGPPGFTSYDGQQLDLYTGPPATYYLTATIPSICGNVVASMTITVVSTGDCKGLGDSFSFVAYPNPANTSMSVSFNEAGSAKATQTGIDTQGTKKSFDIKLYNEKGRVLKQFNNSNKKTIVFDTSDLPKGTYYLHVSDGKQIIKKQIIIQH